MPTIKDVARISGYSVSTVSYALADRKKIPEETRIKIKEIADKIGYKPNVYARGLRNKRVKTIAVFLPGFKGYVHPTILSGIATAIHQDGDQYKLLVTLSRSGYDLAYEGVADVAFIMSPIVKDEEVLKISKICPVILYDKIVEGENIYNTYIDNKKAICKRVIDFYKKGSRKFIFLSGSPMSSHNSERLKGFLEGVKTVGLNENDYTVVDAVGYTERHGFEYLNEFLDMATEKYDALICSNDELAIGALKALKEHNYAVPEQIRVSGFDNIDKGTYINPPLSTIAVDWYEYGIKIGNLALNLLKEEKEENKIDVEASLIDRISG